MTRGLLVPWGLRRAAWHEAGHVVAARAVGIRVRSVEVGTRGGATHFALPPRMTPDAAFRLLVLAVAGEQAERLRFGRDCGEPWPGAWEGDREIAYDLAGPAAGVAEGLDPPTAIRLAKADARAILRDDWPSVRRVARRLMRG
ncbi:MAG: hypothetical protein U0797_12845 [Gemmataceae bacterium]